MPLTIKKQDAVEAQTRAAAAQVKLTSAWAAPLGGDDANRRQDEHLRFLRMVREWADGGDTPPLAPAGHDERVRKVLDDITHAARHAIGAGERAVGPLTAHFHDGQAQAYQDVISRLTEALR